MEPNLYHILNISISSRPAIYMLRIYESACVKLWVVPISSLSDSTTLTSVLGAFSVSNLLELSPTVGRFANFVLLVIWNLRL